MGYGFVFSNDPRYKVSSAAALCDQILLGKSNTSLDNGEGRQLFEVAENFALGGGLRADHRGSIAQLGPLWQGESAKFQP